MDSGHPNPSDQERTVSRSHLSRLAWLPIAPLLAGMVVLWVADVRVAWPAPLLNWFVHYGSVALGVTFVVIPAARSFVANGQPSVLMLGCGVLMMDIGVVAMWGELARSADRAFAIYNTSTLLAGLCHLAGVTITSRRKLRLRRCAAWLTAAYAGGIAVMGLVIWAATTGRMPVFFIEGQGGTLLRSLAVSAAVALFLLTAGLLWQTSHRTASEFFNWYALGLGLLAAGLAGSLAIAVKDSPLQWVTRLTQFFGGLYMCVAVLASMRERRNGIPLAAMEEAWREPAFLAGFRRQTPFGWGVRYGLTLGAMAAAMGLREVLMRWVGAGLPPYITFYPAVMVVALLGGLGPGLVAMALAGILTAYCILPPIGQFSISSPQDRLGLVLFSAMGAFMSVVAQFYRGYRDKAAAYDREAALRESQTERRRAQEALRQNEARYRTLFNAIDAGFCIIEMIFDRQGKPADYRFLEVNAAFEKQTGLRDAEGKTMRELAPAHEAHWFEIYGNIASTGEARHFVNEARQLNRWYDVYAYRAGAPESRQVAILFNDVTSHQQAETEIRRRAEDLRAANDELIRFNRVTVGRELRIIELKKQINDLCAQLGQPPRYQTEADEEARTTA